MTGTDCRRLSVHSTVVDSDTDRPRTQRWRHHICH